MEAFQLLFEKIYEKSNDLVGRVAEVIDVKENVYDQDITNVAELSKFSVNLSDMTIVEV